ncbi:MAG TPA: hypothetical protein VF167_00040 [Longimicrobiaceae bacterium]
MPQQRAVQQALRFLVGKDLRDEFVARADDAYAACRKAYKPHDGWDRLLFGFAIWRYLEKRLRTLIDEDGERLQVRQAKFPNVFWLEVNGIIIAPYRLPWQGEEDLEHAFPYNRTGAGHLTRLNSAYSRARAEVPEIAE